MRDYFMIMRDYFPYYFSEYISDYVGFYAIFFFRLFTIISRRRHPENGNMQSAILDPIMEEWLASVDEEWLLICIDCWSVPVLRINFSILRIICLGWTGLWAHDYGTGMQSS